MRIQDDGKQTSDALWTAYQMLLLCRLSVSEKERMHTGCSKYYLRKYQRKLEKVSYGYACFKPQYIKQTKNNPDFKDKGEMGTNHTAYVLCNI